MPSTVRSGGVRRHASAISTQRAVSRRAAAARAPPRCSAWLCSRSSPCFPSGRNAVPGPHGTSVSHGGRSVNHHGPVSAHLSLPSLQRRRPRGGALGPTGPGQHLEQSAGPGQRPAQPDPRIARLPGPDCGSGPGGRRATSAAVLSQSDIGKVGRFRAAGAGLPGSGPGRQHVLAELPWVCCRPSRSPGCRPSSAGVAAQAA